MDKSLWSKGKFRLTDAIKGFVEGKEQQVSSVVHGGILEWTKILNQIGKKEPIQSI